MDDRGLAVPEATASAKLRALTRFVRALTSALTRDEVIRVSVSEAHAALDATVAAISVWERDVGRLRVLANYGDLAPGEEPFPANESYAVSDFPQIAECEDDPRPWIQVAEDGHGDRHRVVALRRRGRYSALITPIVLSGRIWGELYVARRADQPLYTSVEADFAAVLGAQVSAGLARAAHLAEIERLAHTDPLTGLANRRAIDLRLDEAVARHAADGTDAWLAMCDVNGLKRINDTRGHAAGDRMLVRFAGLLSTAAASLPGSVAGRLGGDEFCVISSGQTMDVVLPVLRRLCERSLELNGGRGVACGIASTAAAAGGADSRDRLFRLADAAQYEAKRTASTEPAIAGSEPDPGPVPGRPSHERRRVRGRVAPDSERLLVAALDAVSVAGIGEPCHPATVVDRIAAVTDTLARAVDAAGWTISARTPDGWRPVRSLRNRPEAGGTSLVVVPGPWRVEIHGDDATVALPTIRPTARAALAAAVVGD